MTNEPTELDITHKGRTFKCKIIKEGERHKLLIPERQFFVQLVRFAPGKGPKDYVDFYKEVDDRLKGENKRTRHDMDIHEIITLITWGRYDMVVVLDAPDAKTYNEFLASYVNPGSPVYFGSTETMVTASAMAHPGG